MTASMHSTRNVEAVIVLVQLWIKNMHLWTIPMIQFSARE